MLSARAPLQLRNECWRTHKVDHQRRWYGIQKKECAFSLKGTPSLLGDSLLDFLRELHQEVTAASSTTTTAPSSDLLGTSLLYQIAKVFVQVFKNYQHVDRVTVPLLKTLQLMLASGYLYLFQPPK